uniref:Uncharacterized protein n=1 Tax=Panagrolaimus davidi TaxID=227884 RepID=A0A914PF87_9BILA
MIAPYCRSVECCILVFSLAENDTGDSSIETLDMWLKFFRDNETPGEAPVVLIGNKVDIVDEKSRSVSKKELNLWCSRNNIEAYFEVSAKDGTNVEETIEEIAKISCIYHSQAEQYCVHYEYYLSVFRKEDNLMFNNLKKRRSDGLFKLENMQYHFPKIKNIDNGFLDAVGIDLGTTRCYAAVKRKNGIESIALENTGNRLLSSYVSFDENHVKCGEVVTNRMQFYEKSTVFDSKRIIGKLYTFIDADNSWQFSITKYFNRAKIGIISPDGKTSKFPEEISAALLKHVKIKCEEIQGKELNETVITVPAMFDEIQNEATYAAAMLAGWKKIHLLPEPVAAAFAYFIDKPIPSNSKLFLFDLGGGTSFLILELEIIGRSGDPYLGGRDFDNILIEYFREQLLSQYGVTVAESKKYKLMMECQEIKHNLSSRNEDKLAVDDYDLTKVNDYIPITRQQFETLAENLLMLIKSNITAALENAGVKLDEINKVLYVGGGSRMPIIKDLLLHETFPNAEHCYEQNPDEVVAVGAAYYSYHLPSFKTNENRCSVI